MSWTGVILGEPASKANSRRLVRFGNRPGIIKSHKARDYLQMVAAQVRPLPELMDGPLSFTARIFYASNRPDLDPSVILDALQGRIYKNDRQVREMHLFHDIDRENPRAEIAIARIAA